jgi:hypothetical protein
MGLYAHMPDPEMGARHDGYMLGQSNVEEQLEIMLPLRNYGVFGDPADPQSELFLGGYTNHNLTPMQQRYNTLMSFVRECVEWGFSSENSTISILGFFEANENYENASRMLIYSWMFLAKLTNLLIWYSNI